MPVPGFRISGRVLFGGDTEGHSEIYVKQARGEGKRRLNYFRLIVRM